MGNHPEVKIAYYTRKDASDMLSYISQSMVPKDRITAMLLEYLIIYSKTFENASFLTSTSSAVYPNGTLAGIVRYINYSEADIAPQTFGMTDDARQRTDFAYPFNIVHSTFLTRKPEYKPETFGIFKTISCTVWITVAVVMVYMFLSYYVTMKSKYAFDKIFLHILGVFLRQGSILKPSSVAENLLLYSWVVGAMFLCLAYDSVFLSFLAIPPVTKIKDVTQLAAAVERGEYHCIARPDSGTYWGLRNSKEKNLRIIGEDLKMNNLNFSSIFMDFILDRSDPNIAVLADMETTELLKVGKKFVSEDRFLGFLGGMMVRKDFCCKKLIDKFVHRLTASGLYFKFLDDITYYSHRISFYNAENDGCNRKLTLTDVSPAFIFLLTGYFISFLVLIGEILLNRRKKGKPFRQSESTCCTAIHKQHPWGCFH